VLSKGATPQLKGRGGWRNLSRCGSEKDVRLLSSGDCDEPFDGETGPGRPPGFQLPQIVVEGVLRKSRKSDVITFKLRVLRLIELTFLVTIHQGGKTKAPVYVRMWIDRSREDKPGSIVVG
jgi:hypothetical protein